MNEMLYDTRTMPDHSQPGNAKIGWSAETGIANFCFPHLACQAAGFADGDLLCLRFTADNDIRVFKGLQKRGHGKSTLRVDQRASGGNFFFVTTSILKFRFASFSRVGVPVWVPKQGEMYLKAPCKEHLLPPKLLGTRKTSFTFDEAVDWFGSSTAGEIKACRNEDPEVFAAVLKGLGRRD